MHVRQHRDSLGDASQVYGATPEFQSAIRRPELARKVAIGATA